MKIKLEFSLDEMKLFNRLLEQEMKATLSGGYYEGEYLTWLSEIKSKVTACILGVV
jgi:hypothetical protein